ncbi:kinase-like domain-containing protein [Mycena alexandri]|uniref:Kinase-like domain-containing protein n=1 Tax=Mycena alexandri TaxID=1745969 RepID=A0AAD6SRZ0_9AGAR|nr:kinase-like domain-containing protein [Mycena alexandri]
MSLGERCEACGVRMVPRQKSPAIHAFPAHSTTTLPAIPRVVPRIEIESLDMIPFSESFSGLFKNENNDDDEPEDNEIAGNEDELQMNSNNEMSYNVEQFSEVKDFDPEWDDEDVAEVMVLSPKQQYSMLPTISEEQDAFSLVSNEAHCSQPQPLAQEDAAVTLADFDIVPTSGYPMLCRKRSTSKMYVIKASSPGLHSEKVVMESILALRAPFLERVQWSFPGVADGEEGRVYLVLESHSGGNLVALVNSESLAPEDALFYVSEVVDGMSSLHAADIIHRDLTPSNIFVDHMGHVILANFCNATTFSPDMECGMPPTAAMEYQAPEILLGWAHDFSVDCWSFGVLLHFLLAGTNPVVDEGSEDTVRGQILNGSAVMSNILPSAASDLIKKCLERNPILRLTIGKIREHDYFATVDWHDVRQKAIPPPTRSRTPSPKLRPTSQDFPLPPSRLSHSLDASFDVSFTVQTASKAVPLLPRLERIHARDAVNEVLRPPFRSFSSMEDLRTRTKLRRRSLPVKSTSTPLLRERRNTQSDEAASPSGTDVSAPGSPPAFPARLSLQIQTPDSLPQIFRPTVLDDRVVEEEEPSPVISSPTICEMSPRERMARFWERFDEEDQQSSSASSSPSLELRDAALRVVLPCPPLPIPRSRSNRLRKRASASSVRPEQRFSIMSATQATGKLRRLRRPLSTPLLAKRSEPILHLPPGVEQIGKGIGFTYRVPAASRSKASICTTSSSAAGRFLRSGLGFGKGLLRRAQSQPRLALPLSGGVGAVRRRGPPARIRTSRELTNTVTPGLHSPVSDGPLTPDSISFPPLPEPEIVSDPFAKDEVGDDPGPTLRLVAVSPSEYRLPSSPTVQPLDNFIFSSWNK